MRTFAISFTKGFCPVSSYYGPPMETVLASTRSIIPQNQRQPRGMGQGGAFFARLEFVHFSGLDDQMISIEFPNERIFYYCFIYYKLLLNFIQFSAFKAFQPCTGKVNIMLLKIFRGLFK